jgi:peptidyl-prolyl cis-trans isomerase B (cyclophilin B)
VASSKQRARKLARARYERQMVARAHRERRRRQVRAGIGATLILALIVVGSIWLLGGFSGDKSPAAQEQCTWTPRDPSDANLTDVGTPPTTGIPTSGTRPMTITLNTGVISVDLDLADAPCAGASFSHLAGRDFFDNTQCHELTTDGALRCGDKAGTGLGGPTYSFYGEDYPVASEATPTPGATPSGSPGATPSGSPATSVTYARGTVAMIAEQQGNFGSQVLIFH